MTKPLATALKGTAPVEPSYQGSVAYVQSIADELKAAGLQDFSLIQQNAINDGLSGFSPKVVAHWLQRHMSDSDGVGDVFKLRTIERPDTTSILLDVFTRISPCPRPTRAELMQGTGISFCLNYPKANDPEMDGLHFISAAGAKTLKFVRASLELQGAVSAGDQIVYDGWNNRGSATKAFAELLVKYGSPKVASAIQPLQAPVSRQPLRDVLQGKLV